MDTEVIHTFSTEVKAKDEDDAREQIEEGNVAMENEEMSGVTILEVSAKGEEP